MKDLKLTHLYLKLTHRFEFHTSREILSGNYRTGSSNAEDSGFGCLDIAPKVPPVLTLCLIQYVYSFLSPILNFVVQRRDVFRCDFLHPK